MFGKRLLTITFILLLVLTSGCIIMGDAVVSVVGAIPDSENALSRKCKIRGAHAKDGRIVSTRQISGAFEESFVLPAGKRDYRFEVVCQDGRRYQSDVYSLGGRNDPFGRVINLGDLDMQVE